MAIIATRGDIHARAVEHVIRERESAEVHTVECDGLSGFPSLQWTSHLAEGTVRDREDVHVRVADIDAIWWRRVNANQATCARITDDHERELVNNDCRGALSGILASTFRGRWISSPEATAAASNKIVQMHIARREGFRVPRTLVSQSKAAVLDFRAAVGRVVVKPLVGSPGPLLFTQFGDALHDLPDHAFESCPAMYQEFIPGNRHIRMNVFGRRAHSALITCSDLDWRPDLNVPIRRWTAPSRLVDRARDTLTSLGLEMGIIDIKLTPDGEPVWLEVNPQGQFLFLEPITGEPLTELFAQYLVAEGAAAAGAAPLDG